MTDRGSNSGGSSRVADNPASSESSIPQVHVVLTLETLPDITVKVIHIQVEIGRAGSSVFAQGNICFDSFGWSGRDCTADCEAKAA